MPRRRLKTEPKPGGKTVTIDEVTHYLLRGHCERNRLKASQWVAGLIRKEVRSNYSETEVRREIVGAVELEDGRATARYDGDA